MRNGSLAIGAGNVNRSEFQMWIAEDFEQGISIVEIGLVRRCPNALEHGQLAEQIVDGLLIIHGAKIQRLVMIA